MGQQIKVGMIKYEGKADGEQVSKAGTPGEVVELENSGTASDALRAAALGNQKPTRVMLNLACWTAFVAWIANFDGGYQNAVLIMPSYNAAFGSQCQQVPVPGAPAGTMMELCLLSATQQSLISVSFLFVAAGGAGAGAAGHWLGRRGALQLGSALCIAGAAGMLGTSGSFLNYMVCKCISGLGIGVLLTSGIIYAAECTAAHKRGLLLGLYNFGLALGNVSAAAVAAGSSTLAPTNDWQWKTPIICQIPLSLVLALGSLFFHESPRWLMLRGREDRARQAFAAFAQQDPHSIFVDAQVEDVRRHIEYERSTTKTTSWVEIYGRHNIRRTLVSALILTSLGLTGIAFVGYYAALFLNGVGIANPFLINVIISLCFLAGAPLSPFASEYLGRRLSLIIGYALMATLMLIFSSVALALDFSDPVARNVVVVLLCLWAFVFATTIGGIVFPASAEVHSVRLRTYGQANSTFFYNIFFFGATFWTPYMLSPEYGNMKATVGYFYFGVTLGILILIYLCMPETARLTLEQIDDYFASRVRPWKTSVARNQHIVNGECNWED
jgi:sugar porter (SP) family MFS transporter